MISLHLFRQRLRNVISHLLVQFFFGPTPSMDVALDVMAHLGQHSSVWISNDRERGAVFVLIHPVVVMWNDVPRPIIKIPGDEPLFHFGMMNSPLKSEFQPDLAQCRSTGFRYVNQL